MLIASAKLETYDICSAGKFAKSFDWTLQIQSLLPKARIVICLYAKAQVQALSTDCY